MAITNDFPVVTSGYLSWHCGINGIDWPFVYSHATGDIGAGSAPGDTRWVFSTGSNVTAIQRSGLIFDTTTLPNGAKIISGKIKCNAKFFVDPYVNTLQLGDTMLFVRAPSIVFPNPVATDYGYLCNCEIQLGSIWIPTSMTSYTACETDLNASGLASIVSGGYTRIGVRASLDTPSGPSLNTCWRCLYEAVLLELTYTTDVELLVETHPATDLTTVSATLNGAIIQGSAIKRGFDWGVDEDNLINEWYEEGSFAVEDFSHGITGLTPGQGLCHRAKASED